MQLLESIDRSYTETKRVLQDKNKFFYSWSMDSQMLGLFITSFQTHNYSDTKRE